MSSSRLYGLKNIFISSLFPCRLFSSIRKVSSYKTNLAASLSLPKTAMNLLSRSPKDVEQSFHLCKDHIKFHAANRVDLFYYLLLAYHNTQKLPAIAQTILQCGRGSHGSVACHSSILTNLVDLPENTSLITKTDFEHSLNLTVELPKWVNIFDYKLEFGHLGRDKSLEILRNVATGKIYSTEGIYEFLYKMQEIFALMKSETSEKKCFLFNKNFDLNTGLAIQKDLIELIEEATLEKTWSAENKNVNMEYIYMMLRLSEKQILSCRSDQQTQERVIQDKSREIQQEIIQAKRVSPGYRKII